MIAEQITRFIASPTKPCETGTLKDWERVEKRLGIQLPSDYKTLIDTYGSGSFDDFIIVYNPFAENEYLNLFYTLDTFCQAEQQIKLLGDPVWTVVHPFTLYPAPEGLLPWGCTANFGETFFWQIKGPPQTWETIFYNLRSGEYEVWKYPMSEFLFRLFTRQIESVLLPEDYPLSTITFIPAE